MARTVSRTEMPSPLRSHDEPSPVQIAPRARALILRCSATCGGLRGRLMASNVAAQSLSHASSARSRRADDRGPMGRTWIDDGLADHPTILAGGPLALALHVRAVCWSRRHKTNGMIPGGALQALVADFADRQGWGQKMCRHGLWESRPDGYFIPGLSPGREAEFASPEEGAQQVIPIEDGSSTTTPRRRNQDRSLQPPADQGKSGEVQEGRKGGSRKVRTDLAETWKHAPWPSAAALAHLWNQEAPDSLPTVESLSSSRISGAKRMLAHFPKKQWWLEVFEQYRASRFLTGRSAKTKGHERWVADFDWLLGSNRQGVENAVRVHDGAFLNS